ncbi:LysR family transcriptional regulator [Reinekea sp.]|uniref:LysR family transcriptional regulator n=1 Tax=Reinekea sp. TaxID=1970455 RepID=UPI003989763E
MAEIRSFNATLQAGSFTRAAELLGVSQPAITAQIRKLESRFDDPLLERFSRGVRATDLGNQLHQITRQYHDLDMAIEVLSNPTLSPDNITLKIANASSIIFMPLIAEFSRRYPLATLKIRSVTTSECQSLVLNREADIGLFPLTHESSQLSQLAFSSHKLVALLRPDHVLASRRCISLKELSAHTLIFYKPESRTQQLLEEMLVRHQLKITSNVIVDSRLDMSEAVFNGLGLGFALEQDLRPDPRLIKLPISEAIDEVIEHVVWMKNRRTLPGIREFIMFALEQRSVMLSKEKICNFQKVNRSQNETN